MFSCWCINSSGATPTQNSNISNTQKNISQNYQSNLNGDMNECPQKNYNQLAYENNINEEFGQYNKFRQVDNLDNGQHQINANKSYKSELNNNENLNKQTNQNLQNLFYKQKDQNEKEELKSEKEQIKYNQNSFQVCPCQNNDSIQYQESSQTIDDNDEKYIDIEYTYNSIIYSQSLKDECNPFENNKVSVSTQPLFYQNQPSFKSSLTDDVFPKSRTSSSSNSTISKASSVKSLRGESLDKIKLTNLANRILQNLGKEKIEKDVQNDQMKIKSIRVHDDSLLRITLEHLENNYIFYAKKCNMHESSEVDECLLNILETYQNRYICNDSEELRTLRNKNQKNEMLKYIIIKTYN